MSSSGKATGNGGSIEDSHTNIFALADLNGLKWRKYVYCNTTPESTTNNSIDVLGDNDCDNAPYVHEDDNFRSVSQNSHIGLKDGNSNKAHSYPITDGNSKFNSSLLSTKLLQNDALFISYSNLLSHNLLCVWRVKPGVSNYNTISEFAKQSRELWVFWHGDDPSFENFIHKDLQDFEIGSWDTGLSYECRTLLFKAFHNNIERYLLLRGFVRLDKWFVEPRLTFHQLYRKRYFDNILNRSSFPLKSTKSPGLNNNNKQFGGNFKHMEQFMNTKSSSAYKLQLAFSFSFFLHGESAICASLQVQKFPCLARFPNLSSNIPPMAPKMNVILAPCGISGILTGKYMKVPDTGVESFIREWHKFMPDKDYATIFFDCDNFSNNNCSNNNSINKDEHHSKRNMSIGANVPDKFNKLAQLELAEILLANNYVTYYPTRHILLVDDPMDALLLDNSTNNFSLGSTLNLPCTTKTKDSKNMEKSKTIPLSLNHNNVNNINNINNPVNSNTNLTPPPSPAFMLHNIPPCKICGLIDTKCVCTSDSKSKSYQTYITPAQGKRQHGEMGKITSTLLATSADETKFLGHATNMDLNAFECDETIAYYEGCMDCQLLNLCTKKGENKMNISLKFPNKTKFCHCNRKQKIPEYLRKLYICQSSINDGQNKNIISTFERLNYIIRKTSLSPNSAIKVSKLKQKPSYRKLHYLMQRRRPNPSSYHKLLNTYDSTLEQIHQNLEPPNILQNISNLHHKIGVTKTKSIDTGMVENNVPKNNVIPTSSSIVISSTEPKNYQVLAEKCNQTTNAFLSSDDNSYINVASKFTDKTKKKDDITIPQPQNVNITLLDPNRKNFNTLYTNRYISFPRWFSINRIRLKRWLIHKRKQYLTQMKFRQLNEEQAHSVNNASNYIQNSIPNPQSHQERYLLNARGTGTQATSDYTPFVKSEPNFTSPLYQNGPSPHTIMMTSSGPNNESQIGPYYNRNNATSHSVITDNNNTNDVKSNINDNGTGKTISTSSTVPPSFDPYEFDEFNEQHARQTNNGMPLMSNSNNNTRKIFNANNNNSKTSLQYGGKSDDSNTNIFQSLKSKDYDFSVTEKTTTSPSGQPLSANAPSLSKILNQPLNHPNPLMPKIPVVSVPLNPGIISNTDLSRIFPTPPSLESNNLYSPCSAPPPIGYVPPQITNNNTIIGSNAITHSIHGPDNICSYPPSINTSTVNFYGAGPTNFSMPNNFANAPHLYSNSGVVGMGSSVKNKPYSYHNPNQQQPLNEFPPPIVQYYSDGTPTLDSLLDRKPLVNPNSLKDTTNSLPDNSLYPGSGKNENLFNHIRTNCDATPPTQTNQLNYHDTKRFHNFPFANDNDVKTALSNSLHLKMPYHDGIRSTINARNQRFNPLSFDLSGSDLRSDTSTIKSPSGHDTSLLNLTSLANSLVQNQSNENWSIDTAVRDDMFNEIDLQHKEIDGLRNFSVKYARFKKLHSNSPNATNTNANITTTQLQPEKFEPNLVHLFSDIKKTSIVTSSTKTHMNSSIIKYTNALYAVLYIESQSYAQMIDINYESSTICACNASIHQHSCNFISPTMSIGSDHVKTKSKYYPCHISPTSIYWYIEQLRNIFNLPNPIPTKLYKPNPAPVGTNMKDDHPENVSQLLNNYVNYILKQDKFIHYVSASKSLKTLSCHNDNTKQSRPRPQNNPQYYHHKCICGFNSYTNQYLSYNNGLFWEDELAIVYATSPTDSQLNSAVPLSAIYGLIRNMMRFIIYFINAHWSTNTSTNLVSNDKAITPFQVVSFEALSDYKRDETWWTRFITKNDAGTINNTRSEKSTAVSPILSGDMLNYVMWFGGASCDPYNSLLSSFIAKEPTSSPSNTILNLSCDNNFLASDKEVTINWRAFMDRCATFESAFQFASSSTVYGDANINLFVNDNNDKANNNTCQIVGLSLLFSAHVWPLMTVESATPDMKVCQHSVRYMRTILRDAIERRTNLMETLAGINNMASVAMVTHTNHLAVDESASSFGEDPFVKANNNSKTACTTTFPGSAPGSNNIPNNPAQFFTSPHNNAMMYGNSHHSHSNKFEQSCIISGPLTWQQFHKLAGRGKEERCEPQPIPQIYINYENDKCVISPLSLSFWDYSHFDPYNMAKDIYYNVITLEEDDCIYMIKEYFTNLNASFETCRFGHHLPMNSGKTPTDYITTLNPQTINENLSSSYPTWITNLKCNSYLKALIQSYHTVFQQKIALIQDVYNKMMYPNKYKTKNIGDNNNNNNYSPSGPPSNSMLINSPKPPALSNNPNNCIPPPSTMQSGTAANLLNQHQKLLNNLYPKTTEVQKFCINQRTSFIIYIVDPCIGPYKNAECNTKTSYFHETNISGQYDRQNQHGQNDKFCKTESDTTENTIHVESPKLMQMYMCNILRAFDDVFLKSSLLPDTIKNRISLKFVPIQYITQSMSFKDRKLYDFLALSTYSGIMYQQPVITSIPYRSFTGFGPGINKNVMRTNNVKKLFATHNQKNSVPNTPTTINVGHKSNPIHAIVKYYAPPYVLALPFHDQWQMRKHLNVGNKSTSIPLAFNPILPNAGLAYQSSATPYMDHHHHHSNHKELGNKYGNTKANTLAGNKVSEEILFCSYCLSHDQTWLIATFTNERGALLTTSLINLHCSNRFKKKELTFIRSVLGKLYTFIIQNIIAKTNHSWRLVFTRVGRLGHGELIGWCELLNHKHLAKTNEQLIESCQVCNMSNPPKSGLKPNNKHHFPVDNNTQHISQATNATPNHEKCSNCPKIMSASLISLACNRHFRVFPESVAPELDRMGPSKYNPLHTPRDISVTHILVIPLSAYSQSNDTTGMDEFNSSANNMRRQGTKSHVGDYNKKTTTYHNNNNKSHMDQQLHNMETDQALDSFYGNSNNNHINLNPSLNDLNNSNFMNLNNGANGCPDDFDILAGVMGALDSIEAAEKEENNANRQQQFNSQNNDVSHLQNTNNDNQQFFKNSGGFNSFSNNQSDPYGLNQNHIDGNMMSTNQSITTTNNNGGVNKSMEIEDDDLLLLKAFNDLPIDQFLMMDMDEVINEVTAGTVGLANINNNNIKTNFNNNTSDDINAFNEPSNINNNNVIGANNMLYNNINANYMGNEARSDMDRSLPTNYFGNETYQQNLNQTHIPTQQNAAYQQFNNHGVQNKLKENSNTGNEEIYLQYNNPAKHAIQSAKEYDNLMAGNRALSLTRVDNTFAANIPTTCADILASILQQQPLALGYYISTAPFNHYVPDWFAQDWDQTLTSFMNASLHLNITLQTGNPLAQNFLETVMFSSSEKDKTHPLDSTQTTIILRFILDSFNQLSWLIIDPFKRDRHSSLPIHIQILFNIYQILMTFSNNGDSNT